MAELHLSMPSKSYRAVLPRVEALDFVLNCVPEHTLEIMGIPVSRRGKYGEIDSIVCTERQAHIVRTMFDTIHNLASRAAVRIAGELDLSGPARDRELRAREYIRHLVYLRNRFARRAWRLFQPYAG